MNKMIFILFSLLWMISCGTGGGEQAFDNRLSNPSSIDYPLDPGDNQFNLAMYAFLRAACPAAIITQPSSDEQILDLSTADSDSTMGEGEETSGTRCARVCDMLIKRTGEDNVLTNLLLLAGYPYNPHLDSVIQTTWIGTALASCPFTDASIR